MTGENAFLTAANRALAPFNRSVQLSQSPDEACGVRANFLGQSTLPWYEEYPVVPSVFVLNGFIYSLVGLYDLSKVGNDKSFCSSFLSVSRHATRITYGRDARGKN